MATSVIPKLVTSRYTLPGIFIGQLVKPSPSNLNADARLPVYIGKGSRLAVGRNLPIRRAYVSGENLAFPAIAPFEATLAHESDGDQFLAKLFQLDGTEVGKDKWTFSKDGNSKFTKILISTEAYDPNKTYKLDYQSVDRSVVDPIPLADLREIIDVANEPDQPQFEEFTDFFINMNLSAITGDTDNTNPPTSGRTIETPVADIGNTGTNDSFLIDVSASYTHSYNRFYTMECTAATGSSGSFAGTFEWQAEINSGGNSVLPPVPLNPAVGTKPTVSFNQATSQLTMTLELGVVVVVNVTSGNVAVGDIYTFNALGEAVVEVDPRYTNTNQFTDEGLITADSGNTGDGSITMAANTSYIGFKNSNFNLNCYAIVETAATGTITAVAQAGISDNEFFTIGSTIYEFNKSGSYTPTAGRIEVDISGDTTNITVANTMRGVINTTQGTVLTAGGATEDVTLTYDTPGDAGNIALAESVSDVAFVVSGATMTGGLIQADFEWAQYGDLFGAFGNFSVTDTNTSTQTQSLTQGVIVDFSFGVLNFDVGDLFTVAVKPPRLHSTVKDDRTYTLTTSAVTATLNAGTIAGTYITDTKEGSFGVFSAISNNTVNGLTATNGHHVFPDNVEIAFRNMFKRTTSGFENRHSANDVFTFTVTNANTIDWTLNQKKTETFTANDLLRDTLGTITGTVGADYLIIGQTPLAGTITVTDSDTNLAISFNAVSNSPFIWFATKPTTTNFIVAYQTKGEEPDPGQIYNFTGKFIRPANLFNTPQLILTRNDGRKLLAPSEVDNHLYIMNEIAWDNNPFGFYIIQVLDADDDGVFNKTDFKTALLASESKSNITDRIVLSSFESLSDQLSVNVKANSPFEKRESLDWFGTPSGTPVGDIDTVDSLVWLSRKTLQVFGNSPSHGTRILVAPSTAKKTIVLENRQSVEVTLDGSFVAGAVAARVAGFNDPSSTILRKLLFGFDDITVHSEKENIILGQNQVLIFENEGAGVIRMVEDTTLDGLDTDFKLISGMTQKQFVTKVVRRELDLTTIAFVVPTGEAGVGLIKGALGGILLGLQGQGKIAPYQNSDGSVRPFNSEGDLVVTRDTSDPTLYFITYRYFLKFPIKRIFGLFSVGAGDFGGGLALSE